MFLKFFKNSQENTYTSLFFVKLHLQTATLLKRGFSTGVFLWIFSKFLRIPILTKPANGCFFIRSQLFYCKKIFYYVCENHFQVWMKIKNFTLRFSNNWKAKRNYIILSFFKIHCWSFCLKVKNFCWTKLAHRRLMLNYQQLFQGLELCL